MENKFSINFFELMFLAESCIPPRPIARASTFNDFSEVHYHNMTDKERLQFYGHVTNCHGFDIENEDCFHFERRFNPNNQYIVTAKWEGEECAFHAYLHNGNFHTSRNRWISSDLVLHYKPKYSL